jgi:DNA-binding SARP family transcriptional activator
MLIRVFGVTEVTSGGGPEVRTIDDFGGVKQRQVLQMLAVHRGEPVTKDQLVEALWPDRPPRDPVGCLESYVSVLRHRLQPGTPRSESAIRTGNGCYRIDLDRVDVDLVRFDRLTASDDTADVHRWESALDLARGPVCGDEAAADWLDPVRRDYDLRVAVVATRAALARLDAGDAERAERHCLVALQKDPWSETATRALMRARWALGRRGDALQAYEDMRVRLLDELGIEPEAETQALFLAVLRSEPAEREVDTGELAGLVAAVIDLLAVARGSTPDRPRESVLPQGRMLRDLVRRAEATVSALLTPVIALSSDTVSDFLALL